MHRHRRRSPWLGSQPLGAIQATIVAALATIGTTAAASGAATAAPAAAKEVPATTQPAKRPAPGVDYVVPLAEQPWATDPDVIWYDAFDTPNAKARYLEFVSPGGSLQQTTDEALGGTGGSIRGLFEKGRVDAGSIKLALGDWPGGRPAQARPGERFDHVYWRLYVKHQAGWIGNPAKLSRAIVMAGGNWSEAAIAHVWGGPGEVLTLDPATGIDPTDRLATTKYNDFDHLRWLGNKPTAVYPIFSTAESGRWVCVEAEATLNTPGRADGTFRLWIDDRLEAERTGLDWRGTWNERGFNAIFLENYWNDGSPVRQARYFDDFVVSTAPIGLARTSLNPEIVKLPFALNSPGDTQVAWQAQVGTDAAEPKLVWDSGEMADAGERVRVDSEHGLFVGPLVGQHALAPGTRYSVRVRQKGEGGAWSDWSRWRIVIQTAAARDGTTR